MIRNLTLAALAACMLGPTIPVVEAQEPAPRPRARARTPRPGVFSFTTNRGRIGVVVQTDAVAADDRIGARIEAVTPGGPADDAGLKAGDIITRFKGTALGGVSAEDDEESGPGMKLIELARALEPGDTVQVEYRRGTENKRATIVAEDLSNSWSMTAPRAGEFTIDPDVRMHIEEGMPGFGYMFGQPWGRLELVTLNPDLAEYFGTREGVLVVKAPADSGLPLKGGDVIVTIGGRKPTSPSHAMRILSSYDTGESVAIEIVRKQRRSTVNWTVPESRGRFRGMMPRVEREEPMRYKVAPVLPLKTRESLRTTRII
jgi:S1-C subfamily serine protease